MSKPELNESYVIYILDCLPEDESPIHHFEDVDTALEVRADLESGNEWAWFCARVTAVYSHPYEAGRGLTGVDYLGACSYRSREDFMAGGYYEDMCAAALADLRAQWDEIVAQRGEVEA